MQEDLFIIRDRRREYLLCTNPIYNLKIPGGRGDGISVVLSRLLVTHDDFCVKKITTASQNSSNSH